MSEGESITFWSVAWGRLLCAVILASSSVIQAIEFGTLFYSENADGNWLFLGGPSVWYATGLLPAVLAAGLLLYAVLSVARVTVTAGGGQALRVEEWRFGRITQNTWKSGENYQAVLGERRIGARWLWVIPLGFHTYMLLWDSVAYLTNPFAYGRGLVTGAYFAFQVVVDIGTLVILLVQAPVHLRVTTAARVAELQCTPPPRILAGLRRLPVFSVPDLLPRGTALRLALAGGALVAAVLTALFGYLGPGEPLRLVIFMIGVLLLVKGLHWATPGPSGPVEPVVPLLGVIAMGLLLVDLAVVAVGYLGHGALGAALLAHLAFNALGIFLLAWVVRLGKKL